VAVAAAVVVADVVAGGCEEEAVVACEPAVAACEAAGAIAAAADIAAERVATVAAV
jgi:hypothetical protein